MEVPEGTDNGPHRVPLDYHLALCEVVSSRLRVACVAELAINLMVDDLDNNTLAQLLEHEEGHN